MGNIMEDRSLLAITEQAAEWFVAQRELLSDAERQQFVAWLQASPLHVREYLAIAATSRDLAEPSLFDDTQVQQLLAGALQEPPLPTNVVPLREQLPMAALPPVTPSRTWSKALAASGVMAAIMVAAWSLNWIDRGQRYEVAGSGQGVWRLSDGSIMHLNAHSVARVNYTSGERRVELQQGEAMFEVSHNPQRPFRVTTGIAEVEALGTSFMVQWAPEDAQVTVVAGTVAVKAESRLSSPASWAQTHAQIRLTPGQRLTMHADGSAGQPEVVEAREAVAWVHREMTFDQQPLALIVAEFNRYSVLPIRIEDTELAQLRISGVFNAYDSASFLQFLRSMPGVDVRTDATEIRVLRPSVGRDNRTAIRELSPLLAGVPNPA